MRKRKLLLVFAVCLAMLLAALVYLRTDLGTVERESFAQKKEAQGAGAKSGERLSVPRAVPPTRPAQQINSPWVRGFEKRGPNVSSSQLAWLGEGWKLVDEGNFQAARLKFQTLINEHAGEPGIPYAFVAIGEAYMLEGGEDNLRQALVQFRDFLVFYPQHELASHARARIAEIKPLLEPMKTPVASSP